MLGLGLGIFPTFYKVPFSMTKPQPIPLALGNCLPGLLLWSSPRAAQVPAPLPAPRAVCSNRRAGVVVLYLEESTDFRELGLGSEEAEGQHRANVLRYGVEMGDEAVGHLWGE